jgi:hypothetical protein
MVSDDAVRREKRGRWTMHIRRGPLFWGLLLLPLGAIPLLARAGLLDPDRLGDIWRLWPLALVGIGLALVLGRGQAGLLGTAIAAIVLGIAGGSVLASGNAWFGPLSGCGNTSTPTESTQTNGAFEVPGTVTIDIRCGTVDITTGPGSEWRVDARYGTQPPMIAATATELNVRAPEQGDIGRQEWTVAVPAPLLRRIDLHANAATSNLRLPGAELESLTANLNAGDLLVDAADGGIAGLDLSLNAGRARITLGRGAVNGTIDVNAGAIDLCVPPEAPLRLTVNDQLTFAHNLRNRGLTQAGTTWTRPGSSADTIDLRIEGNAASLTLDPEGGCR